MLGSLLTIVSTAINASESGPEVLRLLRKAPESLKFVLEADDALNTLKTGLTQALDQAMAYELPKESEHSDQLAIQVQLFEYWIAIANRTVEKSNSHLKTKQAELPELQFIEKMQQLAAFEQHRLDIRKRLLDQIKQDPRYPQAYSYQPLNS